MPDYRLPFADAQRLGLLPDLAPIGVDMRKAIGNLYAELIADNPRMPFGEDTPTCPDSELNEAQRALFGVHQMIDTTPPWEPALLPRILWACRTVGIGKTLEYVEQRIRMSGNDPDALVAAYASDPDRPGPGHRQWKSRFWRDPYTYSDTDWWTSIDHPDHLAFNQRVFDFALRRLADLIVLEGEGRSAETGLDPLELVHQPQDIRPANAFIGAGDGKEDEPLGGAVAQDCCCVVPGLETEHGPGVILRLSKVFAHDRQPSPHAFVVLNGELFGIDANGEGVTLRREAGEPEKGEYQCRSDASCRHRVVPCVNEPAASPIAQPGAIEHWLH